MDFFFENLLQVPTKKKETKDGDAVEDFDDKKEVERTPVRILRWERGSKGFHDDCIQTTPMDKICPSTSYSC